MRGFREIRDEADRLMESVYRAEGEVRKCKNSVQMDSGRVSSAESDLRKAMEVDEEGNYRGDVGAASVRLDMAKWELERSQTELDEARRHLEEVNWEIRNHIGSIDKYTETEERNIRKIGRLVDDEFGSDARNLLEGVKSRHDTALEIRRELLSSMGTDV